jgi:hypothetical protein
MNLSTDNQRRLMWRGMLVFLLGLLLASLALLPVTLVAAESTIENMSASELVRSKDKIPDCRGLQEPAYDIPGSSIGDCVQFFIRKGGEAEDRNDLNSAVLLFGEAISINIGFVLSVTVTTMVARRVKASGGRARAIVAGALASTALSVTSDFTLAYFAQGYDRSLEAVTSRALVAAFIGLVIAFFVTSKSAIRGVS